MLVVYFFHKSIDTGCTNRLDGRYHVIKGGELVEKDFDFIIFDTKGNTHARVGANILQKMRLALMLGFLHETGDDIFRFSPRGNLVGWF